jgi:hypothetical protein
VKDRLNESVQSPRNNNLVKQIWRVKKDSRKNIVLDSAPNNKKPVELMLATVVTSPFKDDDPCAFQC